MDNLYVHKSRAAREHFEKLNIEPIWNVSYSPEFNPIEAVFSKVKAIPQNPKTPDILFVV